jgi:hypothetical protein
MPFCTGVAARQRTHRGLLPIVKPGNALLACGLYSPNIRPYAEAFRATIGRSTLIRDFHAAAGATVIQTLSSTLAALKNARDLAKGLRGS